MSELTSAMTGTAGWDAAVQSFGRTIALAPRNAGIALLLAYRTVVSPLYGDVCKYYPSCSAYSVGAVQQHGLVRGVARTAARLARCHPWAVGGVDDVPPREDFRDDLTRHGFVVPASPRKD